MLLDRTHVRFDGVYVSRNSYIRTGVVEWETRNAVHLVLFFRYMLFFQDGTFVYRTRSHPKCAACFSSTSMARTLGGQMRVSL